MTGPVLGVGAVVFRHDERVLLIRRAHPPAQGSWTLPGGKVRCGEKLHDAVRRELAEETGLDAVPVCLVDVVEISEGTSHFVVLDYLCRLTSDPMRAAASDDAVDLQWVPWHQLPAFHTTSEVQRVVSQALHMHRAQGLRP